MNVISIGAYKIGKDLRYYRYLEAKKTVDDKSLNRRVFANVEKNLPKGKLDVLEIGGGIGTMVERVIDWDLFRRADYDLVERDRGLITRTSDYLKRQNWREPMEIGKDGRGNILLEGPGKEIRLSLKNSDIFEFLGNTSKEYDLIIANSFMDLVNIDGKLEGFLSKLKTEGVFYFTLNFDGVTVFRPKNEHDEEIIQIYHSSMDSSSGSSETGRELLQDLLGKDVYLIDAGSSDWLLYPEGNRYSEDEKYFLFYILKLIEDELKEKNKAFLDVWIEKRRSQIEEGRLIYLAHQIDIAGKNVE